MRTQDEHVAAGAATGPLAGHPAAGPVQGGGGPNVRVAPRGAGVPAEVGGWDCGFGPASGNTASSDAGSPDTGSSDAGSPDAGRRPGRPRSLRAEHAIIDATIEAIGECGIDGVHCEDVAARAGVGKATLYRRWPGKEDLLIAAFAAMRRPLPEPRGESVRDDLVSLLGVVAADTDDPRYAQQYALLHGAGERYPRLVARYKERVVEPRRELIRSVLRRGVAAGQLRPDVNIEVTMLMLTGAIMVRGKHDATPAAPGFVESAVDELLRGIAAAC